MSMYNPQTKMNVFLPNLNFDNQLLNPQSQNGPGVQRVVDCLGPVMGLLSRSGDAVLVRDSGVPDAIPDCLKNVQWVRLSDISQLQQPLRLVPWGWDTEARHLATKLKTDSDIPSVSSVESVNHRSFQAGFDRLEKGNCSLPFGECFGQLCQGINGVEYALNVICQTESSSWIVKAAYSASGRNRLSGSGNTLSLPQSRWIEKQLEASGSVYVEPVYRVIRECGIQFDLELKADSQVHQRLCGVTELLADHTGKYRGSLISREPAELWLPAIPLAERIAAAAGRLGYYGPLGIDCMQIRLQDGTRVLRVGHDINGRHTMGRLALELLPLLGSDQSGCWMHRSPAVPADQAGTSLNFPAAMGRKVVESVQTSPQSIGGIMPAIQTHLLVTSSLKDAQIVAESILAHGN